MILRCIAGTALGVLLLLAPRVVDAQQVTPPSVTQTHTDVNVTVQAPPPDPEVVAQSSTQSFQAIVVQLFAPTIVKWTKDLMDAENVITQTPPGMTYQHEAIRKNSELMRNVAMSLLGLAIFVLGVNIALRQEYGWGRVLMAVAFAATSLFWWQSGIDMLNAINQAIGAPSAQEIIGPHLSLPAIGTNPADAFGAALMVIVYCVVGLMLILSSYMRIALIDVLIVVGPLALMTMATIESSRFSSAYVVTSVGTLFSQIMIVVCLSVSPALAALGTGVSSTLISLCVLWLAKSSTSLVTGAMRSSGGGGISRVGLMMVVRRALLRV